MKRQTARTRLIITPAVRPRLNANVHLSFNELRKSWVVLAPERVFWPDETSVSILRKCDGTRDGGTIIDELAAEYSAPRDDVEADVLDFLQIWADTQLIKETNANG